MSRQYLRAEDRYLIATGQDPEPPRDERQAEKLRLQRAALKTAQTAIEAQKARQKAADATRQRVMDKHPEITHWYWPKVN